MRRRNASRFREKPSWNEDTDTGVGRVNGEKAFRLRTMEQKRGERERESR